MSQSTKPLQKKKWTADDIEDQSGKVFVITGANSGLGLEASRQLARKNATVVMASRSMERGISATGQIKEEFSNVDLDVMQLDLASFTSIRDFASNFNTKYDRLDALLNNAGIMQPPRRETEEGYELQFGVNHLGHFLLTGLLLDKLRTTEDSRVVNQSSIAHRSGTINFDDINSVESYSRTGAYSQSKLANVLFTYELDRRLSNEDGIKSIVVHPGYTATNLQHNGPTVGGKTFLSRIYTITNKILAQDVSMGTLPLLYAATQPDVESGDFIGPRGFLSIRGHPAREKSIERSYDEETAGKLWKISEEFSDYSYP